MQVILNKIFVTTRRIDVVHMSGSCNEDPGMIYTKNELFNKLRENWYYRKNVYHLGQPHKVMKVTSQMVKV